jgi:hypothetical protein
MKRRRLALAILAIIVVVAAYGLGSLNPAIRTSTGVAYSNGGYQNVGSLVITPEASVITGGWAYGMEGAVPLWQDSEGSWHDEGWPDCLSTPGNHRITFGWVSVVTPGGGPGSREVVWVSCP